MTLDEAIQHCEEKAQCGTACGMEHKQLAEWLKELKTLREEYEIKCRILDNVPTDIVADMQKDEPNAVFKMYSWEGDLITSILPIMLEANAFEEINWNWDKKLKEEKQILNKIGV